MHTNITLTLKNVTQDKDIPLAFSSSILEC